jgi:hypothetical protein
VSVSDILLHSHIQGVMLYTIIIVLLTNWALILQLVIVLTLTPTAFSKDEILQNHASVLNTLNIPGHVDDDYELPYLYWIPKLH